MQYTGKIYICGTPIGNMSDASPRLKEVLSSVDIIFAEDTRVTSKLLSVLDINSKLKRMDQNTMEQQLNYVFELVSSGNNIAYCSDAGMPGVSDPGLQLINFAHEKDIAIEVIPGPSAAITAYVAAGFNKSNFYFMGFLPKKSSLRKKELESASNLNAALIIYESPNRLISCLTDISQVYPDSNVAVCRELTKLHEEINVGHAIDLIDNYQSRDSIKGEIVIVIDSCGKDYGHTNTNDAIALAQYLKDCGCKSSEISQALNIAYKIPKNQAYDLSLQVK